MGKYRGIYRIDSARLKHWDYGWPGLYFITICTKDKTCFFGHIQHRTIKFSREGEIAQKIWLDIPNKFRFIELDEYIIMPNHIHGRGCLKKCVKRKKSKNFDT